jgi:hypothetical protein
MRTKGAPVQSAILLVLFGVSRSLHTRTYHGTKEAPRRKAFRDQFSWQQLLRMETPMRPTTQSVAARSVAPC